MIRSKHNKNKSRADAATTSRAQFSHFALGAFSQLTMNLAEYAKGLDISSPEARTNAPRTVDFINDVLNSFPGVYRVSSTVRSEAHNKAVGGVANSLTLFVKKTVFCSFTIMIERDALAKRPISRKSV